MLYIFDWDGTLCDSLSLITGTIGKVSIELGLPMRSEEERKSIIGLGLKEAIATLYPEESDKEIDALVEAYRRTYIADSVEIPSALYDGVQDVLNQLLANDHTLAIATGKSRSGLDRILSQLDMHQYFTHTRCADETLSKPHPLMLEQILEESGFSTNEAVMVGDTDFDLLMAKAASIKAIGVSYGAHPYARVEAAADEMIDHVRELLTIK